MNIRKLYKYYILLFCLTVRGRNIVKKGAKTPGSKKAYGNSGSRRHTTSSAPNSPSHPNSKIPPAQFDSSYKTPMPKGLKVLMAYSAVIAFFYLLLIFLSDSTVFFGILTTGFLARLVFFLFFMSAVVIVYGIAYKKSWCYNFSIIVYLICIANSVFSIFFIGKINDSLIISLYTLIIPIFLITLLMNFVTLWYVYEKRLYFTDPDHVHRHSLADDVFIYTIYLFFFFIILFVIILGSMIFYSATKNISYVMSVTAGMDVSDAESYCERLSDAEARDMCFISVAYNNQDDLDISKICNSVKTGYYRYTCLRITEE
jgi:hypothetical protein